MNKLLLGIISDAIGNAIHIGSVLDNTHQTTDYDLNFTQFDNVDLTSLNISDIVKVILVEYLLPGIFLISQMPSNYSLLF